MADDSRDDGSLGADELRALAGVRAALEGVEREQGRILRDRGRLRDQLEGLLGGLRATGVVLSFDAGGTLTGAEGAVERLLGISPGELVSNFDDIAGGATREAVLEANRKASGPKATLVESDGSLRCGGAERAFHWIHVPRSDDTGDVVGVDVIGLPLADTAQDDGGAEGPDPFEAVFVESAQRIIDDPSDASIEGALATFGESFAMDRMVINGYDEDDRKFSVRSSWLRGGTEPLDAETRGISISEIPWAYSQLGAGELVVISEAADLPSDAVAELRVYAADGVKTSLLVPIMRSESLCGFVSMQSVGTERDWSDTQLAQARRFGMLLSGALAQASSVAALEGARNEAREAVGCAEEAERKAERAEDKAQEAQQGVREISAEAEKSRSRVVELEAELETAGQETRVARELSDAAEQRIRDAEGAADDARSRFDGAKQEAAEARRELDDLKGEVEQAQRRSEATAADALVVRKKLEEARAEANEGRREAAEARVELRALRDGASEDVSIAAPGPESPIVTPEDLGLAELDQEVGAATEAEPDVERERVVSGDYDPDATVEIELPKPGAEAEPTEQADIGDPEETPEIELTQAAETQEGELPRALGLDDILEKTQPVEERASDAETDPATNDLDAEPSASPAVSGPPGIDPAIGLQDVGGNTELYRNLLSKFRQDYLGAAAKIESAIAKGNIEVAHLLLHAVKGVAGMLGAQRVRSTAEDLETNLIGSDETTTQVALDAFTGALNEVLESIAALDEGAELSSADLEEAPGAEIQVADPMVLRSYLSGLRQHLLSEKSKQCQLVMREITARTWPGEFNEQVAELAGLISANKFEAAREAFDALMSTFEDN